MGLLHPRRHRFVGQHTCPVLVGLQSIHHQLKGVEQASSISPTCPQQGLFLHDLHLALRHLVVFLQCAADQPHQHLRRQGFKHIRLASRPQSGDDFKRRVFRRGTDEGDGPGFHSPEQAVLLGFRKPVDLVDEQQGSARKHAVALGGIQHGTHIFHPTVNGTECVEWTVRFGRNQPGECGFPHAGRSPQNHAGQRACLHGAAQNRPLAHEVLLPHIRVQRLGTHSLCKRCLAVHGTNLGL